MKRFPLREGASADQNMEVGHEDENIQETEVLTITWVVVDLTVADNGVRNLVEEIATALDVDIAIDLVAVAMMVGDQLVVIALEAVAEMRIKCLKEVKRFL